MSQGAYSLHCQVQMSTGRFSCEVGDVTGPGCDNHLSREPREPEPPSLYPTLSVQNSSKSLKLLENTARNQDGEQQAPESRAAEGGH